MSEYRSAAFQHQKVFSEKEVWAFWERGTTPDEGGCKVDKFWGGIPTSGRPIYSSSEVPISRIINQGVVKRIRRISDSPNNEDVEEVELVNQFVGHLSSTSATQPPAKKFHSQFIHSTPKSFQPFLFIVPYSIPFPSPNPSTAIPALASPIRSSPFPWPRQLPVLTSKQWTLVARTSRRREYWSHLTFPASQVFQRREHQPIRATRENLNVVNEGKYTVASLFTRADSIIK
ncbi:hypothetical protein O181_057554 [Austropuccinia psidii MF-1]|uniref:Uncharacterized protein n=1 Tax=Austropuccinia psidii MF-1 TaxID=1389203 RepID=A0A9Q3HWS6_9BASI|nr:hypothetical protein [Austropuccinia psidii MF-1]